MPKNPARCEPAILLGVAVLLWKSSSTKGKVARYSGVSSPTRPGEPRAAGYKQADPPGPGCAS